MLLYTGMKVKLKDADYLPSVLLNSYKENDFLYITCIFDNGNALISSTPNGSHSLTVSRDILIPIYDDKILDVLNRKREQLRELYKEVKDIEDFINNRCKE